MKIREHEIRPEPYFMCLLLLDSMPTKKAANAIPISMCIN